MRGRGGFTLVEMMAALLVLGLASAMAAPRMDGALGALRVRSSLQRVAGDLAYARQLAVRTGQRARLRVIPSLDCAAPQGWTAGAGYVVIAGTGVDSVVVRTDLRAGSGRICLSSNQSGEVVFTSRGLLAGFNNRTMVVSAGARVADTLLVSSLGRVLRRP